MSQSPSAESPDQAEGVYRWSEERFRIVLANITDRLLLLEAVRDEHGTVADWRYVEASEGTLKSLGLGREDVLGKTVRAVAPERAAALHERWAEVLATGEPWRYEVTFRGRDLVVRVFRVDERTIGSSAYDVTEQKRAEEALRASDQRKTDFLAVLSHELRNPLAALQSSLHVLDRAPAGSLQADRAIEIIQRQTDHLTRLVDDLLDISRVSHGKIRLTPSRFDAREVVRRACEDIRAAYVDRGVALDVGLAGEPLWLDADPTRFAQIAGNLLTNALKFTPPSGAVHVGLKAQGSACELRVRDTGAGIEPDVLEQIFEPFAQAERTRDRGLGGLGIGLALVKSLVTLQGGDVRALSEGTGRGAEIVVTLPLAPAPAPEAPAPPTAACEALTVLVVEDNQDAGEMLVDLLAIEGHEARLAPSGRAALDALDGWTPAVLLCDIGLPDLSGYEVLRQVRQRDEGSSIFAVALTGYAQPEDLQRAEEAGFDAHLAKPPPLLELRALLAKAAARPR